MARSKSFSYGRLIAKNLHTINGSTRSQNTKIITDTIRGRLHPRTTTTCQAWRTLSSLSGNQEVPTPSPPPPPTSAWSSNWTKWTVGSIVVTTVISLLQFKEDVDFVMKEAEEIIDLVEVVAEAVDMVAEKIDGDLQDGSKLKTTVELVEQVAETVAGKAQNAVAFIDEVQEAEKKLNPVIEPVKQLTQVAPSEAS